MTLEQLQQELIELPSKERWYLVNVLLQSLQKETPHIQTSFVEITALNTLDPWTKSLIGCISLDGNETTESFISDLEEKFR